MRCRREPFRRRGAEIAARNVICVRRRAGLSSGPIRNPRRITWLSHCPSAGRSAKRSGINVLGYRARLHVVLRRLPARPEDAARDHADPPERSMPASPCSIRPMLMEKARTRRLVGNAIKGRRTSVVARHQVRQPRRRRAANTADGRPRCSVVSSCEASLKRLGVDVHRPLLRAPHRSDRADRGHRRRPWPKLVQQGKVRDARA